MRQLFSIGKIIQIRTDPLTVKRLAFVETEEHIRHAVEMLDWLYPDASHILRRGTELHDIGKKLYLERDFTYNGRKWDSRLSRENLTADFYQRGDVKGLFTPDEAIKRYLSFIRRSDFKHMKCFAVRQKPEDDSSPGVVSRYQYQLDPPFSSHAALIEPDDLQDIPEVERSYVHSLIQLHHNFQVDKLVATAAQHGEAIISDLYRLMTADQEGSRWTEYVVQKLGGGQETPQGKFGFSEFAIEAVAAPIEISHDGNHIQGQIMLKATRRPDLGERMIIVDYYLSDCDLTPQKLLSGKKKGDKKK